MTLTPRLRAQMWLLYIASIVIMMGIQLLLPVLPAIQQDLGLSDGEIALVSSVYLLPSVVFAFLSGFLADRFGRKVVFVSSMLLFGISGILIGLSETFELLLFLRFIQGASFAAVFPLSITIIGDMLTGSAQVEAQGHRFIAMAAGDTFLPIIGGVIVALGWHSAFFAQGIAIPLGILTWFTFPQDTKPKHATNIQIRELLQVMRNPTALSLQLAGFLRMFFKFAFMTYLPILLVTNRGMSAAFSGLAIGGSALIGTVIALFSGSMVRRWAPSRIIALSLILIAVSMVAFTVVGTSEPLILLAAFVFGIADSAYGVLQNAAVTQVGSPDLRASFVSATGSIRNLGKFLSPVLMGLSTTVMPLETSFLILAGMATVSLLSVPPLTKIDAQMMGKNEPSITSDSQTMPASGD